MIGPVEEIYKLRKIIDLVEHDPKYLGDNSVISQFHIRRGTVKDLYWCLQNCKGRYYTTQVKEASHGEYSSSLPVIYLNFTLKEDLILFKLSKVNK